MPATPRQKSLGGRCCRLTHRRCSSHRALREHPAGSDQWLRSGFTDRLGPSRVHHGGPAVCAICDPTSAGTSRTGKWIRFQRIVRVFANARLPQRVRSRWCHWGWTEQPRLALRALAHNLPRGGPRIPDFRKGSFHRRQTKQTCNSRDRNSYRLHRRHRGRTDVDGVRESRISP